MLSFPAVASVFARHAVRPCQILLALLQLGLVITTHHPHTFPKSKVIMNVTSILVGVSLLCATAVSSPAATKAKPRQRVLPHTCATCTGSDPCHACKNCSLLPTLRKGGRDLRDLQEVKWCSARQYMSKRSLLCCSGASTRRRRCCCASNADRTSAPRADRPWVSHNWLSNPLGTRKLGNHLSLDRGASGKPVTREHQMIREASQLDGKICPSRKKS